VPHVAALGKFHQLLQAIVEKETSDFLAAP
jgi:hypothetical protein